VIAQLMGYRRPEGRWGVRNHVLVLPLRSAANLAATRIAEAFAGVVAVSHEWEGEPDDPDRLRIEGSIAGFATNPNVAAALLIGVSAEDRVLADRIAAAGQRVEFLAMSQYRGTIGTIAAGVPVARALVAESGRMTREPMPFAGLQLGLECGGSDAMSGVTANPALGIASDLLVAAGGTSILAETPELIGAEHILAARAANEQVARRVIEVITGFETAIRELGVDVRGAQPTPGNQDGGLTTIEEKSLGAAMKGGHAAVSGVLEFAQRPQRTGLHIMDTPGHDIEQMVAMVAGGCNIVAFTTGRGSPTGSAVVPVIKIASNSSTFNRMPGDIDLNAGAVLDRELTLEAMGRLIYDVVVEVANGRQTSSERRGSHEFAISRTVFPMQPAMTALVGTHPR
jgi:altronate dehydratase large subunit